MAALAVIKTGITGLGVIETGITGLGVIEIGVTGSGVTIFGMAMLVSSIECGNCPISAFAVFDGVDDVVFVVVVVVVVVVPWILLVGNRSKSCRETY